MRTAESETTRLGLDMLNVKVWYGIVVFNVPLDTL